MSDARERPTEVFRVTFADESLVLTPERTADDVEGWESVAHITLIHGIADEFGMKFSMRDLESLASVGDPIAIVSRRET